VRMEKIFFKIYICLPIISIAFLKNRYIRLKAVALTFKNTLLDE